MILLLIIVLTSTYTVIGDLHLIVRPTNSQPSICGGHVPCATFSSLLSNNPDVFSNNSDLYLNFLKGTHRVNYLGTQIKVRQKRKTIWHGDNAVIVCQTGLIFIFENTEILEIQGLTFSKCGNRSRSEEPKLHHISAALFLRNVSFFHCKAVTVTRSTGYGLLLFNHLGTAQIQNSHFQHNNKNCKRTSHDLCIGGNIALYFLTRVSTLEKTINISITSCIIKGGKDLSNDLQKLSSCNTTFKANGLAVIFMQKTYRVHFQINKTKFSNNTSHNYPAVLVYDHSEVSNKVEILNTNFSNGGLAVFKQSSKIMTSKFFAIINCLFNATRTQAIKLCICVLSPTKNWPPKLDYKSSLSYPITIDKSSKYLPSRMGPWPPTVLIKDLQRHINVVEFSNCKFHSISGLSSALKTHNSQTVLKSCTFSSFRKTAVIAVNSYNHS